MLDAAQIVVTVLGLALIVCVLFFFFGPRRPKPSNPDRAIQRKPEGRSLKP